jgi:hypothetical protein
VSRGEFDLLRDIVTQQGARMEAIDNHGTRGVGVLQTQITDLTKDFVEMKTENTAWQQSHTAEHVQDKKDKVTGRRWLIGIGIAGLTAIGGMYGFLDIILQHVH